MLGNGKSQEGGSNTQTVFVNFNSKATIPFFNCRLKVNGEPISLNENRVSGRVRSVKVSDDTYQGQILKKLVVSLEDVAPRIGGESGELVRQVYVISFSMNLMAMKMFNRLYNLLKTRSEEAPMISFGISEMKSKGPDGKYTVPVINKGKQLYQINLFTIDDEGKYHMVREYFSQDEKYGVVDPEFNKAQEQSAELESSKPREKFWLSKFSEMSELAFSMFNALLSQNGKKATMKADGTGYVISDLNGAAPVEDTTESHQDSDGAEASPDDLPF